MRKAVSIFLAGIVLIGSLAMAAIPSINRILRVLAVAVRLPRHRAMLLSRCMVMSTASSLDGEEPPVHVTRWGTKGPRVLIIHGGVQGGLGGGPATFIKQKALSEQGWQLVLPDRLGFGASPSHGPDDMEADSIWIASMLCSGTNLIGHSFGGSGALLAAARSPEAVQSLVLVEPALQPLFSGSMAMARYPRARAEFLKLGEALLAARTPADYALTFACSLGAPSRNGSGFNEAANSIEADPKKASALGCALLQARLVSPSALRRAAEAVKQAKVPVLIITGGWSPMFDAVGELGAELTGGRHVIVRSPSHFVQLANPDAFNVVVAAFMAENG